MARILIVDDERTICASLSCLLSGFLGHDVKTAETPLEAVQIGQRWRPDLLIVDWLLGNDMKGSQLVESMRASDAFMPVILMSGLSADELQAEIDLIPRSWFLHKPCEADELYSTIELALQLRNQEGSQITKQ